MSTIYLHQTTALTPELYIAGLTDFGRGRSKLFGTAPMNTSSCINWGARRPTSRKAQAASGSDCTTTGPIQTMSSLRRQTPTSGAARPATPTPSRVRPTEPPTLTLWSSAKERISRDVYLALYWERSARAFWKRRLNKALRLSKLSKPVTTPVESKSRLELANTIQRARQFQSSHPFRRIEQQENDGWLTTDSGECRAELQALAG
jgi:hypothetical protein